MKPNQRWFAVILLIAISPGTTQGDAGPVTTTTAPTPAIRITAIDETRARNLIPATRISGPADVIGIELTLEVGGSDAAAGAYAYGPWHIREAIDDRKTNLQPLPQRPEPQIKDEKDFENLLKAAEKEGPKDSVQPNELFSPIPATSGRFSATLRLAPAARSATRIVRLDGDMTVCTGKLATVKFDRPTRFYGMALDDPTLRAAGISVELLPADSIQDKLTISSPGPQIALRFKGNLHALPQSCFDVIDAVGKSVKGGFGNGTDADKHDDTADSGLKRPLDDTMTLTINVMLDSHSTSIPFSFRDIPLP